MSLRINRLEEQVRQLTGRNEEYQFQIRQLQEQMKALQGGAGVSGRCAPDGRPAAAPDRCATSAAAARSASGNPAERGRADGIGRSRQAAPGPQNLGELPSGPTGGPVTGQPGPLAQEPGAPMVLAPDFNQGGAPQRSAAWTREAPSGGATRLAYGDRQRGGGIRARRGLPAAQGL